MLASFFASFRTPREVADVATPVPRFLATEQVKGYEDPRNPGANKQLTPQARSLLDSLHPDELPRIEDFLRRALEQKFGIVCCSPGEPSPRDAEMTTAVNTGRYKGCYLHAIPASPELTMTQALYLMVVGMPKALTHVGGVFWNLPLSSKFILCLAALPGAEAKKSDARAAYVKLPSGKTVPLVHRDHCPDEVLKAHGSDVGCYPGIKPPNGDCLTFAAGLSPPCDNPQHLLRAGSWLEGRRGHPSEPPNPRITIHDENCKGSRFLLLRNGVEVHYVLLGVDGLLYHQAGPTLPPVALTREESERVLRTGEMLYTEGYPGLVHFTQSGKTHRPTGDFVEMLFGVNGDYCLVMSKAEEAYYRNLACMGHAGNACASHQGTL